MRILLLRHGETPGNKEKRFIGCRTDEGLTAEAQRALEEKTVTADICYTSPLKRARQTAESVFQGEILVKEALKECDFGLLEGKNHQEMSGVPWYEAFLQAGGTKPYPGGEWPEAFYARSLAVFWEIFEEAGAENRKQILVVTHGGVIMGIMAGLFGDNSEIYAFHVDNGCGFLIDTGEKNEISRRTCYRAWKPI